MINIRTIRKLTNNDGLTLKKGKIIKVGDMKIVRGDTSLEKVFLELEAK